jgi:hypothetical protein
VAVTVTPSAQSTTLTPVQAVVEQRPAWILPAIILTSVFTVLVLIILMLRARNDKESIKTGKRGEETHLDNSDDSSPD